MQGNLVFLITSNNKLGSPYPLFLGYLRWPLLVIMGDHGRCRCPKPTRLLIENGIAQQEISYARPILWIHTNVTMPASSMMIEVVGPRHAAQDAWRSAVERACQFRRLTQAVAHRLKASS